MAAHTGNYRYHDDDCWCMMGSGYCNRGGSVWSCCGAVAQASTCAGQGNKHHSAVSDRSGAGTCACADCAPPTTTTTKKPKSATKQG